MNFSNEEDEELVNLVGVNPPLYDVKLEDYKNTLLKENIWKEIGKELNKNSDDCKKRWRHIKDSYTRFMRTHKFITASNAPKNSKWSLYEQLSFLEGGLQRRAVYTFVACDKGEDGSEALEPSQNNIITEESENEEEEFNESSTSYKCKRSTKGIKRRRRNKKDDTTDQNEIQIKNENNLILIKGAPKNDEDISSFCKHIEDVLKSFPPVYKIRAKQEIFTILTNYEMKVADQEQV